jgi:YHS domain-containing protein
MLRLLAYIFDFIFVIVMGWIASRILQAITGGPSAKPRGPQNARTTTRQLNHGETARDPVCGMFVSTEVSHRLEHDGKLLHFCSPECLAKYKSEARHS